MKLEFKIIRYLLKEIVYGNYRLPLLDALASKNINHKKFDYLLIYNELYPFLCILLKNELLKIPTEFFSCLKNHYYSKLFIYMNLYEEMVKILKTAKKEDLLILPIKGFSFTEKYYKKFGFRPLLDIDLLIKECDLEKGIAFLEDLGYKKHLLGATEKYWKEKQCHLEFKKEAELMSIVVELHWALDFKRFRNNFMPAIWERLEEITIEGEKFPALSPEDTLLSLALHQRRFGKVCNLKYICDVAIILKTDNLNWEYLIQTATKEEIKTSLYFLLYQVQLVLDLELNGYLNKLKIVFWKKWLIKKFIKKYAFSPPNPHELAYVYTLCHFLLYDNIFYPIKYILCIPQEQFAKFYSLPLYSNGTSNKYKIRIIYMLYKLVKK